MATSSTKKLLLEALQKMHSSIGIIRITQDFGDDKLIVIIHGNRFINPDVQGVIALLIRYLVQIRVISLVGCDGAFGDVDTDWIKTAKDGDTPVKIDQNTQRSIVDALLKAGELKGVEVARMLSSTPFTLFGPESKELYDRAAGLWEELTPLRDLLNRCATPEQQETTLREAMNSPQWKPLVAKFMEFVELDHQRANAIVDRMLEKMRGMNLQTSVIECQGNLPEYISNELSRRRISYIIIDPTKTTPDDIEKYEKVFAWHKKVMESLD